jgi:F-type H+-transporting ATPase subunit b
MEQLGIQTSLLLAQIVNFAIIAFILTKLLFKPILTMIEKRKKEIQQGLELSEKMKLEEEKIKIKQEQIMEKARADARALLDQTKKEAAVAEKQIIAEAHEEAAVISEKAKKESERLGEEMRKNVQKEAIKLAEAITIQLTKSVISQQDQHKLITQQIKKLQGLQLK